jgi:peptide/nickel transport system permease protein
MLAVVTAYPPAGALSEGRWLAAWRRVRRIWHNRSAALGGALVLAWLLIALLAPLIAPYSPTAQKVTNRLKLPSAQHWFGTDKLGHCGRL